jgi:hypothetical protein
MLLWWRTVRGNRRRWLLCVRSRTIDYSLHWKQKHHRVATPSFSNMVVEVEADWYRLLCPLSHCSSTATLESPFQTQRRTTQITLCPSFLAWITELTNVAKFTEKAYPNNLLLRWCYYDEEETPVRGNLKVVYFVFGAEQCCWFSPHWKQKHHKWQYSFLQYASATRSRRKKLTTDWYRLVYQNYNLGEFFCSCQHNWSRIDVANFHIPTLFYPHTLGSAPFQTKRRTT